MYFAYYLRVWPFDLGNGIEMLDSSKLQGNRNFGKRRQSIMLITDHNATGARITSNWALSIVHHAMALIVEKLPSYVNIRMNVKL